MSKNSYFKHRNIFQMQRMQAYLKESQWFSKEKISQIQFKRLKKLLKFASVNVPYYKNLNKENNLDFDDVRSFVDFKKLPLLTRADVQKAGEDLNSVVLPAHQVCASSVVSSGSTGRPVRVNVTNITQFNWHAFTLFEHLWHGRDFNSKLAIIRRVIPDDVAMPPEGKRISGWGASTDILYDTGSSVVLNIRASIDEQVEWLISEDPSVLLTYPSNLDALVKKMTETGVSLKNLKDIRTFGEIVTSSTRKTCNEACGLKINDIYSAQEVGYIAFQCPENNAYHIQPENILVEVLNEDGKDSLPGEIGKVVVTTLHNYATPLIRYELGDYAEVGEQCSCSRKTQLLNRILGRSRNMMVLPNGEVKWPLIGAIFDGFETFTTVQQYQVVQKQLDKIEVRVVLPKKLTNKEEALLVKKFQASLGYLFTINIIYTDIIERSAGGKHEDFISEITN